MSKRGRIIELAIGAISLTAYINFIYPSLGKLGLGEQLFVNFFFLGVNVTIAWFLIRGAKDKPKVVA